MNDYMKQVVAITSLPFYLATLPLLAGASFVGWLAFRGFAHEAGRLTPSKDTEYRPQTDPASFFAARRAQSMANAQAARERLATLSGGRA